MTDRHLMFRRMFVTYGVLEVVENLTASHRARAVLAVEILSLDVGDGLAPLGRCVRQDREGHRRL